MIKYLTGMQQCTVVICSIIALHPLCAELGCDELEMVEWPGMFLNKGREKSDVVEKEIYFNLSIF